MRLFLLRGFRKSLFHLEMTPPVREPSLTPRPPTPPPLLLHIPATRLDIPQMSQHHRRSMRRTISRPHPPCPTPLPQVEQHLVLPKIVTLQPHPLVTGTPKARRLHRCHLQKAKQLRQTGLAITYTRWMLARWQKVVRSQALAQTILDYLPCWQGERAPRRLRGHRKEQCPQHLPCPRPIRKLTISTPLPSLPHLTRRAAQLRPRLSLPYPPPHRRLNHQNIPKLEPIVLPQPAHLLHLLSMEMEKEASLRTPKVHWRLSHLLFPASKLHLHTDTAAPRHLQYPSTPAPQMYWRLAGEKFSLICLIFRCAYNSIPNICMTGH